MSKRTQLLRYMKKKQEVNASIVLNGEKLDMCIEALEKQIAKEPEVWANGTEHCPCCEKDVTNLYFKVCVECGQRLEGEVDEIDN